MIVAIQASDIQRQNNGVVFHSPSHHGSLTSTPLSAQDSPKISRVPSPPSPSSFNHLSGTPDAEDILEPHMESTIGLESTGHLNVDTALNLHENRLIETLRMELGKATDRKDTLEAENKAKDGLIQALELEKQRLDQESEGTWQDFIDLHLHHDRASRKLAEEKERTQELQRELVVRTNFISNLSSQIQVLEQQKSRTEKELKELRTEVSVLQGKDTAQKEQSDDMREKLDHCRDALRTKDERITELETKVGELVAGSTTKDEKLNELRQQWASVSKENAAVREQAAKLLGDSEHNIRLRAQNTQLRQRNADLETRNGYHQRHIDDLNGQKTLLSTRIDGQHRTIASLLRMDGKRQYEIKDLYHGYACLCVKARSEPISKDVFKTTSHARYEEDDPVNGPCQDSSAPTILSPRPVRPNPTWVHNEFLQQLDLD